MSNEFQKEDRYLVLKWSDMKAAGVTANDTIIQASVKVQNHREANGKIPLETVVVESDWPEYDAVWKMIENRTTMHKIPLKPVSLPIHPHTMGDTWHPDERAAIISYGNERAKEARESLVQAAQGEHGVSIEIQTFAIEVEKQLCAKLGKRWAAAGMSIATLIDELASRVQPVQVAERWHVETNGEEAHVFLDGKQVATFDRNKNPTQEAMYEFFQFLTSPTHHQYRHRG